VFPVGGEGSQPLLPASYELRSWTDAGPHRLQGGGWLNASQLPTLGVRGVPAQTHSETPWPPGGSWLQGVWGGFVDPYRGLGGALFTGSRVSRLMTGVGLFGGVYYGPGGFLGWGWAIGGFVGFFLFFEDVFLG